MSEEANAGGRKATGIHNRPDRSPDRPERAPTSDGLLAEDDLRGSTVQQPDEKVTVSPTQTGCDWASIDWDQAVQYVRKLRQEIFRATKGVSLE